MLLRNQARDERVDTIRGMLDHLLEEARVGREKARELIVDLHNAQTDVPKAEDEDQ